MNDEDILNAMHRVNRVRDSLWSLDEHERRNVLASMMAQLSILVTDEEWDSALSKATRDVL